MTDLSPRIADLAFADISSIGGIESGTRRRLKFLSSNKIIIYGIYLSPYNINILNEHEILTEVKCFFLLNIKKSLLKSPLVNRSINISLTILYILFLKFFYKVNIFHCHDLYCGFSCAIVKGIFPKTKFFVTWHGPASYELINFRPKSRIFKNNQIKLKYRLFVAIYIFMEKVVCTRTNRNMAISEFEKDYFENLTNSKIDILVIRNSVDINKFKPENITLDEIPKNRIIITFIGRLEQKNSPDILLNSIPFLKDYIHEIFFIIVGSGYLENELKTYVNQNNYQNFVSFLGMRYDVDKILKVSDIFVSHCSSLVEGIGNNVIEAIATGIPCIIGYDNINNRIFKTDYNAILVEKDNPKAVADAVIKLIKNKQMLKKISQNSRALALQEFSIDSNLNKMLEIILS